MGTIRPYETERLCGLDSRFEDFLFWWQPTSEHVENSRRYIPGLVKVLLAVQSFVIAYLGFWIYETYLNDLYFQSYVDSSLQGSGFTIIALSSVGIFSAIAVGLYLKLRGTHRELERLISIEPSASEEQGSKPILEPHVEQHLIEMIRKSTPSETSGATSTIPTLKRENG